MRRHSLGGGSDGCFRTKLDVDLRTVEKSISRTWSTPKQLTDGEFFIPMTYALHQQQLNHAALYVHG